MPRNLFSLFLMFCLTGCGGCGGCGRAGPPEGGSVTGTVTLDGAPLTIGAVILAHDDGIAVRQGEIKNDGSFSIVDVPAGKYHAMVKDLPRPEPVKFDDVGRVISSSIPKKEDDKKKKPVVNTKGSVPTKGTIPKKESGPPRSVIPSIYEDLDTTPLRFEVRNGSFLKIELQKDTTPGLVRKKP